MISKQYKLNTKDINYLLRRKQAIYVGGYKILYYEQYSNRLHHQSAIQLSSKIHKSSVIRNLIRRAFFAARDRQIQQSFGQNYYKLFVIVHPEHCEELQQIIKTHKEKKTENRKQKGGHINKVNKKTVKSLEINEIIPTTGPRTTHGNLTQHFSQIISLIPGKIKHSASKMSLARQKPSGGK